MKEEIRKEGSCLILKGMVHSVCTSSSIKNYKTTLKDLLVSLAHISLKAMSFMYLKPSSQSGGSSAAEIEIDVGCGANELKIIY